ncbi:TYRO protein tyrosine kinase-binding protein isoform X2 [Cynoglossus semilaevis]|uniref:TYRO protein tyrosine kinase-binding protein isoform X2 n=1 Tax=Cynoglossus semilaevis TaxID=244447 RepID=UPI0007DCAC71|nr:TYRO protein tyrosine kinase-binding protein isoform X2 [Cynoglossus semilaevis]
MSEAICVAGSLFGSSEEQQECVSCYLISMWSVVAIIAIDIILTVLIVISVFLFATYHKRRREWDSTQVCGRNMSLDAKKRDMTEITESPYQALTS